MYKYNYVFVVCCANFVGYFILIFFPSSSIRIRAKKDDFYWLEIFLCHVLHYLFTSIEETPTWLGVVVFLVCRTAISLVFSWLSKPSEHSVLVVAEFDGNRHKSDHTLPLPQTNNFIVMDRGEVVWLELPDHILSLVSIKLIRIKDFIRFGAVCHSWRTVYIENRHHVSCIRNPPLLMLATELNQDDQTRCLYSLDNKTVVNSQVPVPHYMHCPGSSYGWLVTVSDNWDITLVNPFLSVNNQIQLPSATKFPYHPDHYGALDFGDNFVYVGKIVLSANPSSNPNYVAMAIYSDFERIAFWKPGDDVWTDVDSNFTLISDVVYFEDRFYFVHDEGAIFSCDFNHPHPNVLQVGPIAGSNPSAEKKYLVESFGELLQVCRMTHVQDDDCHYYNVEFQVLKLDRVGVKWIKMDNLHGYVLFVGHNASYSISAVNFTEFKPNSIYFTDDYYIGYYRYITKGIGGGCDMGVFNLEDRTHELYYPTKSSKVPLIPPAIWIEPVLV